MYPGRVRRSVGVGAVAVAFIIAACHGPVSEFKPYTARAAQGYRPSVHHAIEVYEGDISKLIAAGAVLLGTMETDSNGFSTEYVRKQALRDVAARGGTHAVVADIYTIAHWLQISADRAATAVSGDAATTTVTSGAILPVAGYDGTYLVVRVPPSRWSELPESVRPLRGRDLPLTVSQAGATNHA